MTLREKVQRILTLLEKQRAALLRNQVDEADRLNEVIFRRVDELREGGEK